MARTRSCVAEHDGHFIFQTPDVQAPDGHLPANLSPSASYDPIVREENLYIYSMWAYRVETRAHCLAPRWDSSTPRAPRHIDIEFDDSYKAYGT